MTIPILGHQAPQATGSVVQDCIAEAQAAGKIFSVDVGVGEDAVEYLCEGVEAEGTCVYIPRAYSVFKQQIQYTPLIVLYFTPVQVTACTPPEWWEDRKKQAVML